MANQNLLDELTQRLTALIPSSLLDVQQEFERNVRGVLETTFTRLNLVTRAEFDAQAGVLLRTRQRLEELEEAVRHLERLLAEQVQQTSMIEH